MPDTTSLYYFAHEDVEVKNRPPVILIHGAGGSHLSWSPQIRRMAGERIYAPDLPGHGKSEGGGRQSIDEYAADIIAFMDEMKVRAAVLVGHSMGGAVALNLALKHPKRILGLGLIGTGAKLRVNPSLLEMAANPGAFESAVEMVIKNCFSAETSQNLIGLLKRSMLEIRPPVLSGDFLACNEFDVTSQLNEIKVPGLILCGAEDKMTPPKLSEILHDALANSQLHILEHAGHMVMLEQPNAVADLVKQFVDGIPIKTRKPVKKRPAPNATVEPVP